VHADGLRRSASLDHCVRPYRLPTAEFVKHFRPNSGEFAWSASTTGLIWLVCLDGGFEGRGVAVVEIARGWLN
jgi:hypothetical protein